MTKIAIALLSLTAPLVCAAASSGSGPGAPTPGEELVIKTDAVLPLSPEMVKEVNDGGALTVSSPSFPAGYYIVYRFVSSRGGMVQAFSVMDGKPLQGVGMSMPVQVKARGILDEDVSWKLEREVVAMFSYGKSYMPHSEEVLVREAVYGPLAGSLVSRGGGGGFYGSPPRIGGGFAADHVKPDVPDIGDSSKPSDDKDKAASPDKNPGTSPSADPEQGADEAIVDSGEKELSLESLITGDVLEAPSPEAKKLRLASNLKAEPVPEPSSAMLGAFGIACLLMRRKRS